MLQDHSNTFSSAQELVYGADGAVVSTQTLKHAAAKNLGAGAHPMKFMLNATTTDEAVADQSTLQAKLVGSNDSFSTKVVIADSGEITKPAAGNRFFALASHTPCKDYRVEYTVGANGDEFTVTAALVLDQQSAGEGF